MKPCIKAYRPPLGSLTTDSSAVTHNPIADLLPAEICPLAFHTLLPYIYTIMNGGWFAWMQRTKDVNYRKPVQAGDFMNNSVNRLYPNEVLVQCPNPNISVVFGVGPDIKKKQTRIKIRVMHRKTDCTFQHEPGDEWIIDPAQVKLPLADLSVVLGTGMYHALSGMKNRLECSCPGIKSTIQLSSVVGDEPAPREICESINLSSRQQLTVTSMKQRCRYHRNLSTYDISRLSPPGMCPALFHAAYMDSLRLLYSPPSVTDSLGIRCPAVSREVKLTINRIPRRSLIPAAGRRWINRLLNVINRSIDFLDYRVIYTVDSVTGDCPLNHRSGQKYELNLYGQDILCPASFHALYPYMLVFINNGEIIWEPELTASSVAVCPDCVGVRYQFSQP